MSDFFKVNFERLTSLKDERQQAQQAYRLARETFQSLNLRVENMERLMAEEVAASGKSDLQIEFDRIMDNQSAELVKSEEQQTELVNKIDILANELMKENMQGRGATPKELFELLQIRGFTSMSLEYTQGTLVKLKKRGLVVQKSKRYFLSDLGLQHFEKSVDAE